MTFRLYRNGGLKQPFQRYGLAGGRPAEGGQLSLIKFFFRCRSGIFQVIGEYENYLQIAGVRIQMEFMSASSPRDISLILKEKELTADHIAEMRMALVEVTNFQNDTLFRSLSSRVSVETLNSFRLLRNFIDRFDKTSGEMFKRGNRIIHGCLSSLSWLPSWVWHLFGYHGSLIIWPPPKWVNNWSSPASYSLLIFPRNAAASPIALGEKIGTRMRKRRSQCKPEISP
jgi:hypothetical protein